jgi:hypothetical protein
MPDIQDYDQKLKLLQTLRDRLQVTMTPSLYQALKDKDFDSIRTFSDLFFKIDRIDKFLSLYAESRHQEVQKLWYGMSDPSRQYRFVR